MDASAVNGDYKNGSFQNQPNDTEYVSRLRRTASKSVVSIWDGLKKRQRARGNSQAVNDKRWNKRSRTIQTTKSIIDVLLDLLNCYISIPVFSPLL